MEIASRGLPIITPNIGGIAGFLGKDWPAYVSGPEDIDSYVACLNQLFSKTGLAEKLVAIQNQLLKDERSFKAFVKTKSALIKAS